MNAFETGAGSAPLGSPRVHLRTVASTNARARELAMAGAPHGTLVTASEQTAGRGRHGRAWASSPGASLLCSLVLRDAPPLLPLIAGVAVCDAIGEGARAKWPNDVLIGGEGRLGKVAGILVEGRPQERWAVLGIGVNVALRLEQLPPDVRVRAATLARPASAVEPLLADLLAALALRLSEPAGHALAAFRERDALRGQAVSWAGGSGTAQGIDEDGRLLVKLADASVVALNAGDVHLSAAG